MRTFPHVWVPPGGHIGTVQSLHVPCCFIFYLEPGESLETSCLRELEEEIGLKVNSNQNIHILGSWESVYPPFLSLGAPQRHHLVIYLIIAHDLPYSDITSITQVPQFPLIFNNNKSDG